MGNINNHELRQAQIALTQTHHDHIELEDGSQMLVPYAEFKPPLEQRGRKRGKGRKAKLPPLELEEPGRRGPRKFEVKRAKAKRKGLPRGQPPQDPSVGQLKAYHDWAMYEADKLLQQLDGEG
jgi:hypothetical protein